MSRFVALMTSEPFLVRCELHRIRPEVSLASPDHALGLGAYEDHTALIRRYGPGVPHADVWEAPESDAVVLISQGLGVGQSLEENMQPFRFRQWLFAHAGHVERADPVRNALMEMVPDYLQRVVRGSTVSEVMFAIFLKSLRDIGRMEDPGLEAAVAAQCLAQSVRTVDQLAGEVSGPGKSQLAFVATNGRLLIAACRGHDPLYYRLLEGEGSCERCGLTPGGKDSEPLVRDHRRRRSVVVATHPVKPQGWMPLADGGALAIDRKLTPSVLAPTDVR
ncbi:MAG: class II glutamine amidotransferase [Myxococcaceae bacterium]|nr:class II glutamine amidotransferase [Myxococcaceae bacterium]